MDWVALLSAPATVALITVSASAITLILANQHSDKLSERQAAESRARLRFEAQERRYDDRRDAVIGLHDAAERESDMVEAFEEDPSLGYTSPGDIHPEYRFPDLMAAHSRVAILGALEVVEVADELRDAVMETFYGGKVRWERYRAALAAYRSASRTMLANDVQSGDSPQ